MLHHSSPSVDQAGQGTASGTGYKITAYAEARVIELAEAAEVAMRLVHRFDREGFTGIDAIARRRLVGEIAIDAETARLWCCVPLKDSTGFQHA